VAADLGLVADPDEAAEIDSSFGADLQFELAAEEDEPVGAPAPPGGGEETPPQIAAEQPSVPAVQHSVAEEKADRAIHGRRGL
jgi:hypothetical protein